MSPSPKLLTVTVPARSIRAPRRAFLIFAVKIDAAKLRLVPDRIQRQGAWAFVTAHLRDAAGQRFDYAGTPLHTAAQSGGVSSLCAALLRRDGDGWQLVDIAVGPTDVAWEPWAATHKAPAGLFQ